MKKLLIFSIVLAGSVVINPKVDAMATSWDLCSQNDKTKIKKEELPEPVRNKLNGDSYKGWVVVNAYKLGGGGYEVELKKGDTTQAVKFDKDGNVK